jgi:hypothetical protein
VSRRGTTGRKPPGRFLDPARTENAIDQVAALAMREGTRIALAGGCAMQLHGSDRFTQDVDVLAERALDGMDSIGPLSFGGIRSKAKNGVPVDVIVRDDQYQELYTCALDAAARIPGSRIPVVTLPYLAAMKLAAGRDKDQSDLEFILCDSGEPRARVRSVVREHLGLYAADEIDSIFEVAKWKRRRDRGR